MRDKLPSEIPAGMGARNAERRLCVRKIDIAPRVGGKIEDNRAMFQWQHDRGKVMRRMDSTPKLISAQPPAASGEETASPRGATGDLPLTFIQHCGRYAIVRFGLVSTLSTILDYAVLFALLALLPSQLDIKKHLAVSLGYLLGTLVNFVLARRMVFRPTSYLPHVEFLLVAAVAAIGLGLTDLITIALNERAGLGMFIAKTVAVLIVFFWNFLARRYLIYRHAGDKADGGV